jgi:hypothetical protein
MNVAHITFFPNAVGLTGKYYDPSKPGYGSIYFKFMLHELGHLMGLADVYVTSGQSMMKQATSTNDINNNISSTIAPCDRTQVKSAFQTIVADNTSSGGGGGADPSQVVDGLGYDGSVGWNEWAWVDIPTNYGDGYSWHQIYYVIWLVAHSSPAVGV